MKSTTVERWHSCSEKPHAIALSPRSPYDRASFSPAMTVVNEPTLCVASRGFLSASLKASASARLNPLRHFDPISPARGPTLASRRFDQLRCLAMVALATLVVVSASGGTPITRDFVFDNFD